MTSGNTDQGSEARSRHDFSQYTKDLIAKRAGYICSFPNCHQLTTGPSKDRVSGVSLVGVAAHITAASVGGPRYDSTLTPEDRSSETNGVWLCQTHGKLIDDNASRFSVDDIRRWKKQHEAWIFSHLANAENALKDGISRVSIEGVGIFKPPTPLSGDAITEETSCVKILRSETQIKGILKALRRSQGR